MRPCSQNCPIHCRSRSGEEACASEWHDRKGQTAGPGLISSRARCTRTASPRISLTHVARSDAVACGQAVHKRSTRTMHGAWLSTTRRSAREPLDDRFHETGTELEVCSWIPRFEIVRTRVGIMATWRQAVEMAMTEKEIE